MINFFITVIMIDKIEYFQTLNGQQKLFVFASQSINQFIYKSVTFENFVPMF